MASPGEVEVKVSSANNLKNVNWRNGPNRPYAVVWVDPTQKRSTTVDQSGDTQANWDDKLVVPLPSSATVDDSILFIDILHSPTELEAKPLLIGSVRLPLVEARNDATIGSSRTLTLKRPSGRPQGIVDVKVVVKNISYAPPYGVPPPGQQSYGSSYNALPSSSAYAAPYGASYNAAPPTAGYAPYTSSYSAAPATTAYATPAPYGYSQVGQQQYGYGQGGQTVNVGGAVPVNDHKKSKFGIGTGLVMGAVVGGIGALALEKGIDKFEDKIADRAVEKVEEDEDEVEDEDEYYDDDY